MYNGLKKDNAMIKKVFVFTLISISVCLARCSAEEYVSKTNSAHKISYASLPDGYSISAYKDFSLQNTGILYKGRTKRYWSMEDHYYLNGKMVDLQMDEFARQAYLEEMRWQQAQKKKEIAYKRYVIFSWSAFAVITVFGIIGVRKSLRNEAVFFVNWLDALFTVSSVFILFILFFYTPVFVNGWIYLICLASLGYHIFMSVEFNTHFTNPWGMFCIFMGRLFMVCVGAIAMCFLGDSNNKRENRNFSNEAMGFVFRVAFLGAMLSFLNRLINKEEVGGRHLEGNPKFSR